LISHSQIEGNTLFHILNEFLKAYLHFEQVGSDSKAMKNTIEITVFVFHLFGKLPMKKLHFIVLSLRIASGMQKTHTIVV